MRKGSIRAVFCYGYQPGSQRDGGLVVNVFSNDMLSFSTYDLQHRPIEEVCFVLPVGTAMKLIRYIQKGDSWLWNFPPRMCFKETPDRISTSVRDGYPLFRLEDFQLMATVNEFRSTRGHYARNMLNLMEEIAALLDTCGFQLTLHTFSWLPEIQPLPVAPPPQAQPELPDDREMRIG